MANGWLTRFSKVELDMIEVSFFIPVSANSGEMFSPHQMEVFETFLIDRFSGFSRLPGEVHGGWQGDGKIYHDRNSVWMVLVTGVLEFAPQILETVTFAKSHFDQKAIYVRYLGMGEIL